MTYDSRAKALLDHQWLVEGAKEEGREEGRQEGREVGREEGRQEGIEAGELIGKIHILEQLLGHASTDHATLKSETLAQLNERLSKLQSMFRRKQ